VGVSYREHSPLSPIKGGIGVKGIKKKLDINNMQIKKMTKEITPCEEVYFIFRVERKK
jgi:hypothetical protein